MRSNRKTKVNELTMVNAFCFIFIRSNFVCFHCTPVVHKITEIFRIFLLKQTENLHEQQEKILWTATSLKFFRILATALAAARPIVRSLRTWLII